MRQMRQIEPTAKTELDLEYQCVFLERLRAMTTLGHMVLALSSFGPICFLSLPDVTTIEKPPDLSQRKNGHSSATTGSFFLLPVLVRSCGVLNVRRSPMVEDRAVVVVRR